MNWQQRMDLRTAIEMREYWQRTHSEEMAWTRCAEIFTGKRSVSVATRALVESWKLANFDPLAPLSEGGAS